MLHDVSRSNTLQSLTIVITKRAIASARMVMLGNDKLEGHLIQLCPEVTKATRTPPTDIYTKNEKVRAFQSTNFPCNCTQKYRSSLRNIYHFFPKLEPKDFAVHSKIETLFLCICTQKYHSPLQNIFHFLS